MSNQNLQQQENTSFKSTLTFHDDRYEDLLKEMGMSDDDKDDHRPNAEINPKSAIGIISSRVMAFKS
ncbi:MAG: hypothetical protein KA100_00935 [Rickettsiales bacterium]|nr:hypothetical protein [Rickettsiales bacterium]